MQARNLNSKYFFILSSENISLNLLFIVSLKCTVNMGDDQSYTSQVHTTYKHLKKGAHQSHLGRQKNGLVSGRLACTSSKTEILNKIGI